MFYIDTLENGLRVVSEPIGHVRSVAMGVWIGVGSTQERLTDNGMSHFVEHMLFKGTDTRSAAAIAAEVDGVGGHINAYTSKEYTYLYVQVLDEHMELAVSLLSDMLLHSKLDPVEMDKERGVILEEINMVEDTPDDIVHELANELYFGSHPLGRTILGPKENIEGFTAHNMRTFMQAQYTPANVVVSMAGHFDKTRLDELLQQYLGGWQGSRPALDLSKVTACRGVVQREKEGEQTHLCLTLPGIDIYDRPAVFTLNMLNNIFGGGMSSRLFQKVREERGLAYSVYSYLSLHREGGMIGIYSGQSPQQAAEVVKLVLAEAQDLQRHGVTQAEFHLAKEQLKGNYILGMESTTSRMSAMGRSQLIQNTVYTLDDILDTINGVTWEMVNEMAAAILDTHAMGGAAVGRIPEGFDLAALLA